MREGAAKYRLLETALVAVGLFGRRVKE